MIIDSTSPDGDQTPWLVVHDGEKVRYLTDSLWFEITENITEYNMYQNNLKEVESWNS